MNNWGKSVNAEMQIPRSIDKMSETVTHRGQEQDTSTSPRHLEQVKIYAELKRNWSAKKLKNFRADLWKHYRIREDIYEKMFNDQEGNCNCCGKNRVEQERNLAVDHDHATGEIRALLCDQCNVGLGMLTDCLQRTRMLLAYIDKFKK